MKADWVFEDGKTGISFKRCNFYNAIDIENLVEGLKRREDVLKNGVESFAWQYALGQLIEKDYLKQQIVLIGEDDEGNYYPVSVHNSLHQHDEYVINHAEPKVRRAVARHLYNYHEKQRVLAVVEESQDSSKSPDVVEDIGLNFKIREVSKSMVIS